MNFEKLKGKRIAFLMANEGVEQVELTEPLEAVRGSGAEAEILAPEAGEDFPDVIVSRRLVDADEECPPRDLRGAHAFSPMSNFSHTIDENEASDRVHEWTEILRDELSLRLDRALAGDALAPIAGNLRAGGIDPYGAALEVLGDRERLLALLSGGRGT